MNYTIHQLNIFLKVVEKKSITKASEELFMTQPAVSIQLKNFQDQFNVPLTEIIGRQLFVTDFGMEIARIAERVLNELDELKFKTFEYEGLVKGRLRISAASTGKYVIPFFLTEFLKRHDGVDLLLDVTNKSMVLESLKKNELDFALVSVVPKDIEVEEEVLLDNMLYLVGNQQNPFSEDTLIYREQGSATRQVMEEYFESRGVIKRKKIELTSNEAVKQSIIAGLGQSIIPLIGIKNEIIDGTVTIIPQQGLPIKTQWRLIWLKNKKLSPVAKAYLHFLRTEKETILKNHFQWYQEFTQSFLSTPNN